MGEVVEMNGKTVIEYLEDVIYACEEIKSADMCEHCPMRGNCIEDAPLTEIAFDTPSDALDEILKMGKNPRFYTMSGEEQIEFLMRNR